jgi:hypothetical protein
VRIGVLSDTHDRLPTLRAALARFQAAGIDTLVHPGDVISPFAAKALAAFPGSIHVTYGNNDGERTGLRQVLPQIQDGPLWVQLGKRRVLVHHYLDWCAATDVAQADVVITGHTHVVDVRREAGKLLLNPGECCGWVYGRCTAAILDLETLDVEVFEVTS